MNQPTPKQIAAKVARFNEIVKPDDVIRYRELRDEGPGRLYKVAGPASNLSGHSSVVWLWGKRECVQTDHCEVLTDQAQAVEEYNRTRANEFADLMKDEGPPRTEAPAEPQWKTSDPPKDGTIFVAIGRVVWSDEFGGESWPFVAMVHFNGEQWLDEIGMALTESPLDTVHIDYWIQIPPGSAMPPKPEKRTELHDPLCEVEGCGHTGTFAVESKSAEGFRHLVCSRHFDANVIQTADGRLMEGPEQ